jgi:hypothetical protein
MASGNGGQVAFAKIGSLYTDVNTVNQWGNFVSETVEHKLNEVVEGSINGRRDAPNSYKGIDHADGDLVFEPNPNVIGMFLKAWFGTYTSSTVTGATSSGANSTFYAGAQQSFHRFTPNQSAFSDRTFLEPYNLMIYRDVTSAWLHKGVIFPSLKFDIKAGALAKATATVMGRQTDRIQRTAAIQSLVSSGGRPWIWDMASIELSTDTTTANLAARTDFEELNIVMDLPHSGIALLDGTKRYAEFVPTNFRSIKIDGTMSFRDQTAYDAFVAYEARRLRVTMLNVNSALMLGNPASLDATSFLGYFGLRFIFPQMKFTSWSAPISGPNRITAKFAAKAEYNEAEGISAVAELNNVANSAYYTQTY